MTVCVVSTLLFICGLSSICVAAKDWHQKISMLQELCLYFSRDWKFSFSSPDVAAQFAAADRMICISAHSTPFLDGMLLHVALQKFGVPNHIFYVRGLFGFCPIWCKEISNVRGFIRSEIELLKSEASFCRMIFPSGGTVEWKSGFYALAKETKAIIIILGLDYKTKQVIVDSCLSTDEDFNIVKLKAVNQLKKYGAGPVYFIMRVLIGYGCLTYDIKPSTLIITRLSVSILAMFLVVRFIFPVFSVWFVLSSTWIGSIRYALHSLWRFRPTKSMKMSNHFFIFSVSLYSIYFHTCFWSIIFLNQFKQAEFSLTVSSKYSLVIDDITIDEPHDT